jgi:hypothetical protein
MYRLCIFYMLSANVSVMLSVSYKANPATVPHLSYKIHPQ